MQPKAKDNTTSFPLDELELSAISDRKLAKVFQDAPVIHKYGGVAVVRLSKSLVCKGGRGVAVSESHTMKLAKSLQLPVPKVHRTFSSNVPGLGGGPAVKGHFIVMDYLPGSTVEECWDALSQSERESVVNQASAIINRMQSIPLQRPPGPVGRSKHQKFEGHWFTENGAGPFETLDDLENWCNHKIDVCIRYSQAPEDTPRFVFKEVVLTHQDIAPRNLLFDDQQKLWLIDWGLAGAYPPGFEQAAFRSQSGWDKEFTIMVLNRLSDPQNSVVDQFRTIGYGLSVAANR